MKPLTEKQLKTWRPVVLATVVTFSVAFRTLFYATGVFGIACFGLALAHGMMTGIPVALDSPYVFGGVTAIMVNMILLGFAHFFGIGFQTGYIWKFYERMAFLLLCVAATLLLYPVEFTVSVAQAATIWSFTELFGISGLLCAGFLAFLHFGYRWIERMPEDPSTA